MRNIFHIIAYMFEIVPLLVLFAFLTAILSSISGILSIILIREILNSFNSNGTSNLYLLIFIIFCYQLISITISAAYNKYIYPKYSLVLQQNMQKEIFIKVSTMNLFLFDSSEFYDKYNLALQNSDTRALGVMQSFAHLLANVISIIFLSGYIVFIEPYVIIFVIINVIIHIIINTVNARLGYGFSKTSIYPKRRMAYINRIFYLQQYAKEIRLLNVIEALLNFYDNAVDHLHKIIRKFAIKQSIVSLMQGFSQMFFNLSLILFLINRVAKGLLYAGDFVALFNSTSQLSGNLTSVFNSVPEFYEHSLYITNFRDFMNVIPDKTGNKHLQGPINTIKIKGVSYSYNSNKKVLHNISLHIHKGQKIAFVGPNGAGKSTLIKLILSLYEPDSGQILFNDIPKAAYEQKSFSDKFGVIFQDSQIFALSIAENILMRPIKNYEEDKIIVENSLKLVGMYEKINTLKHGILTNPTKEMDPEGNVFSGGEQQKIIFGRIFSRDFDVLVLDEPSSAMDGFSEIELFNQVMKIYNDKIIILISHTLSNIVNCDNIFYIEDGQIIESGTHEELLKINGNYKKLYEIQSKGYI